MAETFTLRVDKSLMDRIDGYAQSKEMKKAEAFRSLIELGLKVSDIRDDETSDIEEEFKRLFLEIFLRVNQQYLLSAEDVKIADLQSNTEKIRSRIKGVFPLISEKYEELLRSKKEE